MPKVIFHHGNGWSEETIIELGGYVRRHIAELCSTAQSPLEIEDVDWVPIPYNPGTLVATPCSIEIETFGFPFRKLKMKGALSDLKSNIVSFVNAMTATKGEDIRIPEDKPLVWLKYVDPEGEHV